MFKWSKIVGLIADTAYSICNVISDDLLSVTSPGSQQYIDLYDRSLKEGSTVFYDDVSDAIIRVTTASF